MEGKVFGVNTFAGKETRLNPFIWVSNNCVTEDYLREPLVSSPLCKHLLAAELFAKFPLM